MPQLSAVPLEREKGILFMRMHISIILFLALIFQSGISHQIKSQSTLIEKDSIELVRLTLQYALSERHIPDYKLIKDTINYILLPINIQPSWIPQLLGHKIILMSTDSIQAKADREGDFLFLEFKYFQTQNDESVKVCLDNDWCFSRLPTSGSHSNLSGGGIILTFFRDGQSWKRSELMQIWIR
jgi:hypothetical protein